jgi:YD repeat-containing protein
MVAIFTGAGTGLVRGSGSVLGGRGQIGASSFGRASENVYVNAANGNLVITRQDEFLVGLGPDVAISRTSNSQRTGDSDNADSWRESFNRKLSLSGTYGTVGSRVQRMDWDASDTWLDWNSAQNAYVLTDGSGAYDKLTRSGTVWTWVDGSSRVTELYDDTWGGLVTRTTDTDGNSLAYDYETYNGLPHIKRISVLNAAGATVERVDAVYDGLKLTQLVTTKADGTTLTRVRYGYETYLGGTATRLTSVEVDLSPEDNSVADGRKYVLTYTYADTSTVRIASIAETDGAQLSFTYDSSNRVTSLTELVSAGVTRTTTLAYYSGYTSVTDATGAVTTLYYDAKGQLTQLTQPPAAAGGTAQTTSFAYNANGDVISTTDPTGNVTTFQYDSNGNEVSRQDRLGNVVTRTYGSKNELLTETHSLELNLSFATSAYAPTVTGSKLLGSVDGYWGSATSNQSYTGSAFVSGRRLHPANGYTFLGLTDSVLTTNGPYEYDYSFYFYEDSIRTWENGGQASVAVASGVTDNMVCTIEYDGAQVIYRIDGAIVRQVAAGAGRTFKAGVSTAYTARGVQDLAFGSSPSDPSLVPATTRFVYDSENHLRYAVSPEGVVTEYRYTTTGDLEYQIEYPEHVYTFPGLGALLTSTSYETPEMGNGYQYNPSIAGMTFSGNSGLTGNASAWGFAAAPEGDQVAFLQAVTATGGSIAQSLSGLTVGAQYNVKFLLAARPYANGATPVTVSFNGSVIGTYTPASAAFQEFTASFTATATTGTVTFSTPAAAGDQATALDNVRVVRGLSEADLDGWRNGLADRSSTKIAYNSYDFRGNLTSTNRYGIATAGGGISSAEGYSRTVYVYDLAGQLLSRATDGQSAETFVYDGMGRVIASTDRNQGTTNIVFNDSTTQTVVTLASGLVTTSTYNKAGDLVSSIESGSYVAGGTTTSKYDKMGRLRMTTDAAGFKKYFVYDKVGRLVAEVNHRGDLVEYRYDANDRLIATARYINAITTANLTTLDNPDSTIEMSTLRPSWHPWDVWSWTTYDKEGRVTSTMDGTIRTYEYDKSGRLVKTVAYYNGLDWNQIVAFQTNPPTAPVVPAADARDSVSRNFYDKAGRLLAALDAEGYLTRNTYDRAGQLVEKVAYLNASAVAYRASGTLNQLVANQATDANDRRIRFVYDGQGQLRFEVDGFNQVAEYGYNAAGKLVSTVRYAGSIAATSDYTYDNIKALVAASGLASAAATRKSWTVYDGSGRIAYAIGPEGAVSALSYDNMGQVTKTVAFAVARPTTSAPDFATMSSWAAGQSGNAANRVTRAYYNARGEKRFTVDSEGFVNRNDYDAAGRTIGEYRWSNVVAVSDASTIANVDALQGGTWTGNSYTYDFGGALTDVVNAEGNWYHYGYFSTGQMLFDFNVYQDAYYTYYNYSTFGQLVAKTEANGSPESASHQYGYDGLGNLKTVIDPRNNATNRTFDHLGRVKTETDPAGGIVTYEYNAFGEVSKVTDARGNFSTMAYDRLGRLVSATDAMGVVTTRSYDVFGDLLTVTRGTAATSFEYDRAGRVTKTTDAEGYYELYTLDVFGNRTSVRNMIGGVVVNAYDRRGLLVAEILPMTSVDSNGTVMASTVTNKFEYDERGNRTKKIEAFGLAEQRTTTYFYDRADRLTETRGDAVSTMNSDWVNSTVATPSEKLKYDQRGRVIERTDALGGRTLYYYDAMGRVKVELGTAGTYTAFTYDANGNVLTRRVYATAVGLPGTAGGTPPGAPAGEYRETVYTYDALNRLKTTSVAGIRTGAWNGSYYATTASATVTTSIDYDLNGNVVRTVDANLVSAFAYYDKANRKIGEVDREGYLTFLFLDGEGNVVQEVRYATRVTGATATSDPEALRNSVSGGGARVTSFDYDKNGRRRFETRTGVNANALDASGNLVAGAASSTIEYSYNGLGEVTQKTEANGDYVSYAYDATGRLTQENRAPYLDQNGASVRPTIAYSYNGINELSVTRQGGVAAAAGDRYTRYTYGAGGRVATMTDANGAAYTYYYDVAGNVMRESYYRYKADGNYTIDSLLYTRDQLGRVTSQGLASWNGSAWVHGDRQKTAFNTYGDVAQRGVNDLWQEQLSYDLAGRLVKSNSGDGVWRFFTYDGNGNQTLALESEGGDYSGYSLDQAIAAATAGGSVGGAYVDNINATIAAYDKRGQQVATRLPFRQLSASVTQTLTSARVYNAYGEVTSETDARGYTTDFAYNAMGRLIQKQSPTVAYTSAGGVVSSARPTENYYYDVSGRMIAFDDANGNRIRRALLAGTGHGGTEALVTAEYHPDGGVFRTFYDVFGDARILRNELGYDETRAYDAMGRLTQTTHRGGLLADYYAYDLLGQRIKHWNSVLGTGNMETTGYDMQGRVTSQVSFGGVATSIGYAWSSAVATAGIGTFGGWTKTILNPTGYYSSETLDLFGRSTARTDQGGRGYAYAYDMAGRLISQTGPSGQSQTYSYFNTNRGYQIVDTAGTGNSITATFGYDASGNRTYEGYAGTVWAFHYGNYHLSGYQTLQNATIDYDALGRITAFTDRDGGGTIRITFTTEFDLVGNVRHSTSSFPNIAYPQYTNYLTNDWFLYDSMNRMTLTGGDLVSGAIVRGQDGVSLAYDAAGQRRTAIHGVALTGYAEVWVQDGGYGPPYQLPEEIGGENGHWETQQSNYWGDRREEYDYRADGYLTDIRFADEGYYDTGSGYTAANGTMGAAVLRGSNSRDYMGRVTQYREFDAYGYTTYDRYSIVYDGASRVTSEALSQKKLESGAPHTYLTYTVNTYGGPGGALSYSTADNYRDGSDSALADTSTSFSYAMWGDAQVSSSTHDSDTGSGSNALWTSTYYYDGLGRLGSVDIADGRRRSVSFASNPGGQTLSRIERSAATNNPNDFYYFVDGAQVGEMTNNGNYDPTRLDYSNTFVTRNWTANPISAPFRWNTQGGVTAGQFGGSGYDPISPTSNGMAGTDSRYTIREGDTLASVAASLWGDASLWYMIAEANGLSGNQSLPAGTSLIIPDKVTNIHNSAKTFEVYDPNRALGDLSPTAAKPPKKAGKCGMFGMIMLVAIAVAVTVITAGAAAAIAAPGLTLMQGIGVALGGSAVLGVGAASVTVSATTFGLAVFGAIGAAAGSIVSQGVGVATGLQNKFSWKSVAMAGIGGGIGGALGGVIKGATFIAGAARGALGSAATQGIGVAIGLQKKFDFVGVAAAAVSGGVSAHIGGKLSEVPGLNRYVAHGLSGTASALANAATRSLIQGSDFGDNIMAALPDVIGSTLGNMIADRVAAIGTHRKSAVRSSGKDAALRQDPEEGDVIVITRNFDPNVSPREPFENRAEAERALAMESEENGLTSSDGARIGRIVEESGSFYVEWETVAKPDGKLRYRYAMEDGTVGTPIGIAPAGDPFSTEVNVEKLNRRGIYNQVENDRVYVYVDEYGNPVTRTQYSASPSDFTRTLQDYSLVRAAYNHAARDPVGRANFDKFLRTDIPIILSPTGTDEYHTLHSFIVWSPTAALELPDGRYQSPALGLYHEIGHALRYQENMSRALDMGRMGHLADDGTRRMPWSEYDVITNLESPLARALGEPARLYHRDTHVRRVLRPIDFSNEPRHR